MNQRKHQEDYELVHQYLCGDKAAGQKLYSEAFPFFPKVFLNNELSNANNPANKFRRAIKSI